MSNNVLAPIILARGPDTNGSDIKLPTGTALQPDSTSGLEQVLGRRSYGWGQVRTTRVLEKLAKRLAPGVAQVFDAELIRAPRSNASGHGVPVGVGLSAVRPDGARLDGAGLNAAGSAGARPDLERIRTTIARALAQTYPTEHGAPNQGQVDPAELVGHVVCETAAARLSEFGPDSRTLGRVADLIELLGNANISPTGMVRRLLTRIDGANSANVDRTDVLVSDEFVALGTSLGKTIAILENRKATSGAQFVSFIGRGMADRVLEILYSPASDGNSTGAAGAVNFQENFDSLVAGLVAQLPQHLRNDYRDRIYGAADSLLLEAITLDSQQTLDKLDGIREAAEQDPWSVVGELVTGLLLGERLEVAKFMAQYIVGSRPFDASMCVGVCQTTIKLVSSVVDSQRQVLDRCRDDVVAKLREEDRQTIDQLAYLMTQAGLSENEIRGYQVEGDGSRDPLSLGLIALRDIPDLARLVRVRYEELSSDSSTLTMHVSASPTSPASSDSPTSPLSPTPPLSPTSYDSPTPPTSPTGRTPPYAPAIGVDNDSEFMMRLAATPYLSGQPEMMALRRIARTVANHSLSGQFGRNVADVFEASHDLLVMISNGHRAGYPDRHDVVVSRQVKYCAQDVATSLIEACLSYRGGVATILLPLVTVLNSQLTRTLNDQVTTQGNATYALRHSIGNAFRGYVARLERGAAGEAGEAGVTRVIGEAGENNETRESEEGRQPKDALKALETLCTMIIDATTHQIESVSPTDLDELVKRTNAYFASRWPKL